MTQLPEEPLDIGADQDSDTIATPEGDDEFRPGQPLSPSEPTPQRPRGDQPHSTEPLYPALD